MHTMQHAMFVVSLLNPWIFISSDCGISFHYQFTDRIFIHLKLHLRSYDLSIYVLVKLQKLDDDSNEEKKRFH